MSHSLVRPSFRKFLWVLVAVPTLLLLAAVSFTANTTAGVDPLDLTKSFNDDPATPGGTVTLEFNIVNRNRDFAASDMSFTDDLDAVLSGLTAVGLPLANPCGPGSQLAGAGSLTLTGGNLPAEDSCNFSVTLQVPTNAASGIYPNTTSTITGLVNGDDVVGSPAADNLEIKAVPVLRKAFSEDVVSPGDAVTLQFTITNTHSSNNATVIAFTDNFSPTLPGFTAVGLPANNVCGAGSQISGTTLLNFTGGNLAAGASCTFDVTIQIAADTSAGNYVNTTGVLTAVLGGNEETSNAASDTLLVVTAPRLQKSFIDDPVLPGSTVTLEFSLFNSESSPADAANIAFTDDLDAALSGLQAVGLPANDICGAGSQLSGTSNLSFTGGSLAIVETCTFTVTLQVPGSTNPGTYVNTTSIVSASLAGESTTSSPASANLEITPIAFSKSFTDDPILHGEIVTLEFNIVNGSDIFSTTEMTFTDNLGLVLPGLTAVGLPANDICGSGSQLAGTNFLTFTGGNLAPGTSCTFSVSLQVPEATPAGTYTNKTSPFSAKLDDTQVTLNPANDTLTVLEELSLTKSFSDGPVFPGSTVELDFTLVNNHPISNVTSISFTDNLSDTLFGLVAVGLPINNICGAGSQLAGTDLLTFTGGNLAANTSCTFSVSLQVPGYVLPGSYPNTTSQVTAVLGGDGFTNSAATDVLEIVEEHLIYLPAILKD